MTIVEINPQYHRVSLHYSITKVEITARTKLLSTLSKSYRNEYSCVHVGRMLIDYSRLRLGCAV